jgi:hypothetical protein
MRRNKAKKYGLYSRPFHFHFYILTIMKFCSINYYIFIHFYVYWNNNVLRLRQYYRFMAMEMLLLPQTVDMTFLFLMQASKPMTLILRYFHMLVAYFFFKLWQTSMSKTFYLTYVYLNYIQGSKSSTAIVSHSQS